ncbi:hypothetical protein ACRALDRAFT_1060377 [Sodiomyces alcalophilus JCM 7366]|uniref:uncharacterized protein n=1 Tax=Sodiomyces alcalophilus JCM 7366 TaxID=591952 RepID=UPI0039B6D7EA
METGMLSRQSVDSCPCSDAPLRSGGVIARGEVNLKGDLSGYERSTKTNSKLRVKFRDLFSQPGWVV